MTVSRVQKMTENGVVFYVTADDCKHVRGLDSQKVHKKALFGSGFLLSDKAAEYSDNALRAAAGAAAAAGKTENAIQWELSKRELEIIKGLGSTGQNLGSQGENK